MTARSAARQQSPTRGHVQVRADTVRLGTRFRPGPESVIRSLEGLAPMRPRRSAFPALALLLLCLPAALGCENHGAPENHASGTTPAPVPKVDAKQAARVQVTAEQRANPWAGGEGTGSGHLTLTGDYRVAEDTAVRCERFTMFGDQILNLNFIDPRSTLEVPRVQVDIVGPIGTGSVKGFVTVASTRQEGLVGSHGTAQVQLTVTPTAQPRQGSLLTGQLSGIFVGDAGEGNVTGRFDCFLRGASFGDSKQMKHETGSYTSLSR